MIMFREKVYLNITGEKIETRTKFVDSIVFRHDNVEQKSARATKIPFEKSCGVPTIIQILVYVTDLSRDFAGFMN